VSAEARLAELSLELPAAPKVMGLYKPVLVVGNLAYLSGHGPVQPDGTLTCGIVGKDLDLAAGQQAARRTGLVMLSSLKGHLGSLDRIKRLVKTFGMVRCTADFVDQPAVINGFSELMKDVFGEENGIAARSAMGAVSLPAGMAVEVEAIFELHPE
jgi:enamine deaminase RidA (YjgF/YER057c/UK114 family)